MPKSANLQLSEQHITEILLHWWSISTPTIKPTNQGTVNTTFFVEAPYLGKFVFKIYSDTTTTAQIHYEHSLLKYLQSCNLSFAVPTPIPSNSGETLVTVNQNDKILRVALLPLILGQTAERENIIHIGAAGQALGKLHKALAEFDTDGQQSQLPNWGNLENLHPLVAPLEVPRILELEYSQQERIIKSLTELIEVAPDLYKTLPFQTTHADYLCPNVLVHKNQVVGILDFEFATYDLRLLDYVAALDHFTRPSKQVPNKERIKAFSVGYAKHVSLSSLEIEKLTFAWRLQQASCIVYWTGWFLENIVTHQSVVDGVVKMLQLEDWLQENTIRFLNCTIW
ncbi:homoserine kinase [Calothrix sp. NIES-4071]|nr:homoserine kinase [Calothrix sp. NIES-4071]BAZ56946.1 homoserine kinase [Calothrix sp. NIES-4105]